MAKQAYDFEAFYKGKVEENTTKIFEMEMAFLETKHQAIRGEKVL